MHLLTFKINFLSRIAYLALLFPFFGSIKLFNLSPLVMGHLLIGFLFIELIIVRVSSFNINKMLAYIVFLGFYSLVVILNVEGGYLYEKIIFNYILIIDFAVAYHCFVDKKINLKLFSKLILVLTLFLTWYLPYFGENIEYAKLYFGDDLLFTGVFGNSNNNSMVIFSAYVLYILICKEDFSKMLLMITFFTLIATSSRFFLIGFILVNILTLNRAAPYFFLLFVVVFFISIYAHLIQGISNVYISNKLNSFDMTLNNFIGDRPDFWSGFLKLNWFPFGIIQDGSIFNDGELHSYLFELLSIFGLFALPIFIFFYSNVKILYALNYKYSIYISLILIGSFVTSTLSMTFAWVIVMAGLFAYAELHFKV